MSSGKLLVFCACTRPAANMHSAEIELYCTCSLALLDQPSVGKHFDIGNIEVVTHLAKGPHPCSEGIPLQRSHVHQI